jgi:hypothetical protein
MGRAGEYLRAGLGEIILVAVSIMELLVGTCHNISGEVATGDITGSRAASNGGTSTTSRSSTPRSLSFLQVIGFAVDRFRITVPTRAL